MTLKDRELPNTVASNRIAVTPETHRRLKDFSTGLGVTQDRAINILLNMALKFGSSITPKSPELMIGASLRDQLEALEHLANSDLVGLSD